MSFNLLANELYGEDTQNRLFCASKPIVLDIKRAYFEI